MKRFIVPFLFLTLTACSEKQIKDLDTWLNTPSPVTGKTPTQVLSEAPKQALTGDWFNLVGGLAGIAAGAVVTAIGAKKVVAKVAAKKGT